MINERFCFVIFFEISKFAAKIQQIFDIYKFILIFLQNNNNKYQKGVCRWFWHTPLV